MKKEYILPSGFASAGIYAGIKKTKKLDVGLIYSAEPCDAVGFFTKNSLKSVHIMAAKKIINGKIQAVFANSGSANALTGKAGFEDLKNILVSVAKNLNLKPKQILAAATGKISKRIPVEKVVNIMTDLVSNLSTHDSSFPRSIMTTDTAEKYATEIVTINGKKVTVCAAGKGAGMISPTMATMLVFVTTDAAIDKRLLREAAFEAVKSSFNRITVDGDMSPNDTVYVLANGAAENKKIVSKSKDYMKLKKAFADVFYSIAEDMVMDGEGATKFIKLNISGAKNQLQAERVARQVANSQLVKTAFFGESLNPGRIISAAGQTFEDFNPEKITLKFNGRAIISGGKMLDANYTQVSKELKKRRVEVDLNLANGKYYCFLLTTDLSYDYVKINADYS
jgi:glutamate N-acetyltransferase / amino-acid N-acetyltransferase